MSNSKVCGVHVLRIAVGIIVVVLFIGIANAADFVVCKKECEYSSIQEAIDASRNGDTVLVEGGTYYENVNVNKKITLRGIGMPVVDARRKNNAIKLSANGIELEGFTVTNSSRHNGAGIMVTSHGNVLRGNNASNNFNGIILSGSSNNTLIGNNASGNCNPSKFGFCNYGIFLGSSSNNSLISNIESNNYIGIVLSNSNDNTLSGNNASINYGGIYMYDSSGNVFKKNILTGNRYNFELTAYDASYFNNTIEKNNLIDGKAIYYIKDVKDTIYDSSSNAGTFYCINCVNVTVKDLNMTNNSYGVFFWNTTLSKVKNVTIYNSSIGIYLYDSGNNALEDNNIINNGIGINLLRSNHNKVMNNIANDGSHGISLDWSNNNKIKRNNASSNKYAGISISYSSNNTLIGNNASMNRQGIRIYTDRDGEDGDSEYFTTNNTLKKNIMKGNIYNFELIVHRINDFKNQIDKSNLVDGKPIYYLNGAVNTIYDSSTNAGTFYCINCVNVTVKDLNFTNNSHGVFFMNTTLSRIQNVNASNNTVHGILLYFSTNNTLRGNFVSNNNILLSYYTYRGNGIYLLDSSNNTIEKNRILKNNNGILIEYSVGNLLKSNRVSKNDKGIYLISSSSSNLKRNRVSNNDLGIYIDYSNNIMLADNLMNKNIYNFGLIGYETSHFNNTIHKSNLVNGKPILYLRGASNTIYDNSTNAGTFYCINCVNVTLKDMNLTENLKGIFFRNTTRSKIQNVNLSGNRIGIYLSDSSNNTLRSNNVMDSKKYVSRGFYINDKGIYLSDSSNNTLSGNNVSNNGNGILIDNSRRNILNGNKVSNNSIGMSLSSSNFNNLIDNKALNNDEGIYLSSSNDNIIMSNFASDKNSIGIELYGSRNNMLNRNNVSNNNLHGIILFSSIYNNLSSNNISNNKNGINIVFSSSNKIHNNVFNNEENVRFFEIETDSNNWNTTKQSGINIIGGSYIGGNFWGNPKGTGFSQTCMDDNKDGICDSTYTLDSGNVDFLPLTIPAGYGYIYGTVLNNSMGISSATIATKTSFQ
ncbi:MAG: hypothetical protein C3F06_06095 [Candidatus Methanoperedenaceae archaeon]|nr:MAG: hypothetical protein C3F06_06095 [Candidatus Methanoperedenaceae archaeon]